MRLRRQGRDAQGRRVQRTFKRHDGTGQINGYEHEHADGRQDALVQPPTVIAEFRPSDFGLTRQQFIELLGVNVRHFPPKQAHRSGGLIIPGEEITWR
jgi:hypothetical protein